MFIGIAEGWSQKKSSILTQFISLLDEKCLHLHCVLIQLQKQEWMVSWATRQKPEQCAETTEIVYRNNYSGFFFGISISEFKLKRCGVFFKLWDKGLWQLWTEYTELKTFFKTIFLAVIGNYFIITVAWLPGSQIDCELEHVQTLWTCLPGTCPYAGTCPVNISTCHWNP